MDQSKNHVRSCIHKFAMVSGVCVESVQCLIFLGIIIALLVEGQDGVKT